MFALTSSHGSEASSWNTTPTPSGTSPAIGRPSKSRSPSLTAVSPAIASSSVDLPQPDGPTTAKNSPRSRSRSIGPSALTSACVFVAGKTRVTPRSATISVTASRLPLQVVRQEALVDDLAPVGIVLERADDLLRAHHLVHGLEVDLAAAPVAHAGLVVAGEQVLERAARDLGREVVGLGDD